MLGGAGPSVLSAIVVLSVVPSAMALLMMAPRLYVAMSRDGLFPPTLAAIRGDGRTPARAMALLALLASAFVLAGTFQQIVAFFLCSALVFIAMAAAALFVIRGREPQTPFASPGYPIGPALFVALVMTVVALVAMARPLQALAGFALVLLGLPARRVLLKRMPKNGGNVD